MIQTLLHVLFCYLLVGFGAFLVAAVDDTMNWANFYDREWWFGAISTIFVWPVFLIVLLQQLFNSRRR